MNGKLPIWVIYDHPSDYPDYWVARCWLLDKPTDTYFFKQELEDLRYIFKDMGLTRLNRQPGDDPCIVETWL